MSPVKLVGGSGRLLRSSFVKTELKNWFNMEAMESSLVTVFPEGSLSGPTFARELVRLLMYEYIARGFDLEFRASFRSNFFLAFLTAFVTSF